MKKLALLAVLCLTLCGCSNTSREIDTGMALRSRLLKAESVSWDADITADYGDEFYTFSMGCRGDSQGNVSFTVTGPDTIAGISGSLGAQGGKLTFDDTALAFELLADHQLSPVSAPWILLTTLRSGCLTSACAEEDRIRLSIDDSYRDDALHLDIWLDSEDRPAQADILYGQRRILSLAIKNFVIT